MSRFFLGNGTDRLGTIDDGKTSNPQESQLAMGVTGMHFANRITEKGDAIVEVEEMLGFVLQRSAQALVDCG
ncbi:hypothetical protein D3C84_1023710 [compost metagenome]